MTAKLVEAMPDAVLVCNRHGIIEAANSRAACLFACRVDDLMGRSRSDLGLSRDAGADARSGSQHAAIVSLTAMDGGTFSAWLQSGESPDGDVQTLVLRKMPVSDAVTLEPEMSVLETLAEGVLIVDQGATITYANQAGRTMLGLDQAADAPQTVRDLISSVAPGSSTGEQSHFIDDVLHSGQTLSQVDACLQGAALGSCELSINATPLPSTGSGPTGAIISFQNVTRQKHAELQISVQKQVLDMIAAGKELEETGALIINYLERVIPGTRGAIYQLDRESRSIVLVAAPRIPEHVARIPSESAEDPVSAMCVETLMTRQPLIRPRIEAGETSAEFAEALSSSGVRGLWCFPVDSIANRSLGVICLYRDNSGEPDSEVQSLIDIAAGLLRIALDRVQIERDLKFQSFNDDLTGLPNRVLLMDRLDVALQRAAQSDHQVALLLLNIDKFQMVNNSLGHHAGDELLREVARRLRESLRSDDLVARFTGDTFGILLDNISSEADAINVVMRIQRGFATPLIVTGIEIYISMSIGIALATEPDANADTLVRYSDIALNRAKEVGRGQFAIFSPAQDLSRVPQIELQSRLHRALAADALELHFQPVVSLRDRKIAGYEALVRWTDKQFGVVSPDEFLPLAQQSGIMSEITSWVLDRAVSQLSDWHKAYNLQVFCAVNISPGELKDSLLVEQVDAVLQRYRIDPQCLVLEMTEHALVDTSGSPSRILDRLRDLGVRIALDDFGTGFSSLSYLENLAVDVIKIDRAFVQAARGGASRAPVAAAMVDLARGLGMLSVAEGIETEEDERVARQLGCDLSQGYYYGRPQPGVFLTPNMRNQSKDSS